MMKKACVFLATCALMGFGSVGAKAAIIDVFLPEFSGDFFDASASYPLPAVDMGTFLYAIPPGDTIVSAFVEGQFGNSANTTSAGHDVFLDGLLVAQCIPFDTCWTGPGPNPWSHTFTSGEFGLLADGSADMTAIQTNEFTIREGEFHLHIETVPEQGTMSMLGAGALVLGGLYRRRRK